MKSNGIKIFAGYTLILFIVVFGITKLFEVPLEAAEENVSDPAVTTTAVTEPEPDPNAPKEEDPRADNTWALFLVNDQNPIPKEYSDNLDTSVVYESTRKFEMDSRVEQYIRDMFEAASEDGIDLVMCSAYRSFSKQDVNGKILHGRVKDLFHLPVQAVDLIHKQDIPLLKIIQDRSHLSWFFDRRTAGHLQMRPHFVGNDPRQRRLAQAGRPVKQHMV